MEYLIDFNNTHNDQEAADNHELAGAQTPKQYHYDMFEDEAFIITTYFTNVWLRAHEDAADIVPGTFPDRSYNRQKMVISLGQYEISLKFNAFEIVPEENHYAYQWWADITNNLTNDALKLVVESEYDYSPGDVTSKSGRECARAFGDYIICQCETEFGYAIGNASKLRLKICLELPEHDDEDNVLIYPEWFSKALPGYGD